MVKNVAIDYFPKNQNLVSYEFFLWKQKHGNLPKKFVLSKNLLSIKLIIGDFIHKKNFDTEVLSFRKHWYRKYFLKKSCYRNQFLFFIEKLDIDLLFYRKKVFIYMFGKEENSYRITFLLEFFLFFFFWSFFANTTVIDMLFIVIAQYLIVNFFV